MSHNMLRENSISTGGDEKAQVSVGAIFAFALIILAFIGVISYAYAYIGSPVVDAENFAGEAEMVGNDMVYETLNKSKTNTTISSSPTLNADKTEKFFKNDAYTDAAEQHPIITNNGLNVSVKLTKTVDKGGLEDHSIFNGSDLTRNVDAKPFETSTYTEQVIVQGQMATLTVHTWREE